MTHKDIYTKFMIEYDKANVTSSYPSLTEYEVATVLDKAYNALIAQKVTGNNLRRAPFEADLKAITDIQPLVVRDSITFTEESGVNIAKADLPADFLYYVQLMINQNCTTPIDTEDETTDDTTKKTTHPYDRHDVRQLPVKLTSHDVAEKFIITPYNMPWVKNPVAFMEYDDIYVVFDPVKKPEIEPASITYVKVPNKFVKDLDKLQNRHDIWNKIKSDDFTYADLEALDPTTMSYFYFSDNMDLEDVDASIKNAHAALFQYLDSVYTFECNDTVAEELISLAVAFALENVESQRLNSKLNMRGLEA